MRVETEIKKWGNSLALRVTRIMARVPQFEAGTKVTIDVSAEGFVVKRAVGSPGTIRLPHAETALIEGLTPDKAHADGLASLTAVEVGS